MAGVNTKQIIWFLVRIKYKFDSSIAVVLSEHISRNSGGLKIFNGSFAICLFHVCTKYNKTLTFTFWFDNDDYLYSRDRSIFTIKSMYLNPEPVGFFARYLTRWWAALRHIVQVGYSVADGFFCCQCETPRQLHQLFCRSDLAVSQ